MITKTFSAAVAGVQAHLITIETEVAQGMSSWIIVGLPDTSVQEARSRVRAAMKESGFLFPYNFRIITNLAPAETKKSGSAFDVALALSVIAKQKELHGLEKIIAIGELGLDGTVHPVHGVLALVQAAAAHQITNAFVPVQNLVEAALVQNVNVFPIHTLKELVQHISGEQLIAPITHVAPQPAQIFYENTFESIAGNEFAKRALEIAAAGKHHVLLSGPPGVGKTMLARALPSILAPLSHEESLEVTQIYSVSSLAHTTDEFPITHAPFRAPHHTITAAALIGGGNMIRPGEITLAHHGVLFLDELPEFSRDALEQLREPLESGSILLHRANHIVEFPARCITIAAQNPCPCGFATHPRKECRCTGNDLRRYRKKLSGPLLDRFDMFCEVAPLDTHALVRKKVTETSAHIQQRVIAARALLRRTAPEDVLATCSASGKNLLLSAAEKLELSARGVNKVARVANTIAALAGKDCYGAAEIMEALHFRQPI